MKTKLDYARDNLTRFVTDKAHALSKALGFGFEDTTQAPTDFEALKRAYEYSLKTLKPLPVWSGACENTIFTNFHGNLAFRFWHDILHCTLDRGFDFYSEIEVGYNMLESVIREFGIDSLEYKLLKADTIGQTTYYKHYKAFPENQLQFAIDYIKIIED